MLYNLTNRYAIYISMTQPIMKYIALQLSSLNQLCGMLQNSIGYKLNAINNFVNLLA